VKGTARDNTVTTSAALSSITLAPFWRALARHPGQW